MEKIGDLKKIIAICRKNGVKALKLPELELELHQTPPKITRRKKPGTTDQSEFETASLKDLNDPYYQLFYSAG